MTTSLPSPVPATVGSGFAGRSNATTGQVPGVPSPVGTTAAPDWHFLVGWTTAWLGVGLVVAAGISFGAGVDFGPVLRLSVLFAQVVGYSAYTSARLVFPILAGLPFALRLVLDSLILLSGTIFGSILVVVIEPFFLLAQFRTVLLIFLLNAVLAALVAVALGTYDRMRRQIEASYRVLRERDALERELRVARDVQRQLLPSTVPEVAGLELAGVCRQAIAVGGDYYDYLPLEDGRLGLVIADVSGKGVPAALLMASLQASVRSLFTTTVNPGALGGNLNDAVFRASSAARYATAFLASYDPTTRRLSYTNAGHLPPLVVRRGDTVECHEGGMPVGLFEGSTYDTGTVTLAPGDLLALFTDGVTEAPAPDGEEFGARRLDELLRNAGERPLDAMLETILEALGSWSGDVAPHDDVTIVLARAR